MTSPRPAPPQVVVLSPVEEGEFPKEWYEIASADHFWMEWRLRAFLDQARDLGVDLGASLRGLEVGCGVGTLRRQLEQATAWTVDGADLIRAALDASQAQRGRNLLYDVNHRSPELAGRYDFILLFDVLEHIAEPARFLESCLFHLRPGGWVFLNVPALNALWSGYDKAAGHLRRYDRSSIRAEFAEHDVVIEDVRYWGMTMVPLLILRTLMLGARPGVSSEAVIRDGFRPPGKVAHAALKALMRMETGLLRRPPVGTSLLATARKALGSFPGP